MDRPLLLIDGMYLIFNSFYANPHMRTMSGQPTGAIFGFISRVEAMMNELRPEAVVVALDSREKTFRHDLLTGYKAKRDAPPEELIAQLPLVEEYLSLRNIPLLRRPGLEGDDIIAVLTHRETAQGKSVVIFSADKDLFQLVRDGVRIYHPKNRQLLDAQGIEEQYGIRPERIVDYLSLCGDSSDNIPGVPGIGDKGAQKLLNQYESLEALIEAAEARSGDKLLLKVADNLEALKLSRRLVDLSKEALPPYDDAVPPFNPAPVQNLAPLLDRLAFSSLSERLGVTQETSTPLPFKETRIVRTETDLLQLVKALEHEPVIGIDVETSDLRPHIADLIGLSLVSPGHRFYIPLMGPLTEGPYLPREKVIAATAPILANPKIRKAGHNIKFDLSHLHRHGFTVEGVGDDSMVLGYLLHPNRRNHQLKDMSSEYLRVAQKTFDELTGSGKNARPLVEVPVAEIAEYCADDSDCSLQLVQQLRPALADKGLEPLYGEVEMPLLSVLAGMEATGVRVDRAYLELSRRTLSRRIDALTMEIFDLAKCTFNLNSSQQLGELLFEKMNLPSGKKTRKTGAYSTDTEVLSELAGVPIVDLIIEYRGLRKLLSTYVVGLADELDADSRVHTSYNQAVAATGRLSSSNPNLQNIPVGEIGGVVMRKAFTASPGWRLLAADYSQVELRVMAHFAEDPALINSFVNGLDIHSHTAEHVFAGREDLTEAEKRRRAKIVNFSILYGSGPYSLGKELGVSFAEAKELIDRFFVTYAGVRRFIDETLAKAEQDPVVTTYLGRRRDIPEIQSSNRNVRENGQRMAVNTIIQGSAADLIKLAMIRIAGQLAGKQSRMLMQVHDELVFEYPPEEETWLLEMVRREMEQVASLRVPLKVDLKAGENWGEMTKI